MSQQRRVKSDITLLEIVEALKELEGAGVSEIADTVGVAKSSAHAHLSTLEEMEYVTKEEGVYHLGLRFLNYGMFTRNQQDIFQHSVSAVDELAERTGERVWCMTEEHGKALYLYAGVGEHSVRTWVRTGERMDLHCLAGGKAMLAHLPEERRQAIVLESELKPATEYSITDPEELQNQLEQIRKSGVAYNYEESVKDLHAIGAPVRGENGEVYGSISISGPANRLTKERMEGEYKDTLLGSANEIEINLRHA